MAKPLSVKSLQTRPERHGTRGARSEGRFPVRHAGTVASTSRREQTKAADAGVQSLRTRRSGMRQVRRSRRRRPRRPRRPCQPPWAPGRWGARRGAGCGVSRGPGPASRKAGSPSARPLLISNTAELAAGVQAGPGGVCAALSSGGASCPVRRGGCDSKSCAES